MRAFHASFICCFCVLLTLSSAEDVTSPSTFAESREKGARDSAYLKPAKKQATLKPGEVPEPDLIRFREEIEPLLKETCLDCHGPEKQKSDFRVDTLDPDLINGTDAPWWLEVMEVVSNGEMPPEDEEAQLSDKGKAAVIDWLSTEIQVASQVARSEHGHSSFRRLTRYEFNYALQDLLGLSFDLASDLPPETPSEDGFLNSSEMLQMSVSQLETYREISRKALEKATVRGQQPDPVYYRITMDQGIRQMRGDVDAKLASLRAQEKPDAKKLKSLEKQLSEVELSEGKRSNAHFIDLKTGIGGVSKYRYGGYRWDPVDSRPEIPEVSSQVLVLPEGKRHIFDLSDQLPESGTMRVRFRASRAVASDEDDVFPSLRLSFGFQPSNNSQASEQVGPGDFPILADPDNPELLICDIPLGEIARNAYRGVTKVGTRPNPTEYLIFQNASWNGVKGDVGDIRIDYIDVTAPFYDTWPPKTHTNLFPGEAMPSDEVAEARRVLEAFMPRAWRREVTGEEVAQKLDLFERVRPDCDDFQGAMIEVLATVLASPKFLYLVQSRPGEANEGIVPVTDEELASRLSTFLWASVPDEALLKLARDGQLRMPDVLAAQVERLLDDSRSERFARQFVRQWLGMQLLDFLAVDKKVYRTFDTDLKKAMQEEPVAFFLEVLHSDASVMDFLHADYAMVNNRLAKHYRLPPVHGSAFQRVTLEEGGQRGGLLTQAGLLAMNSDGKDSHPLKRGIWLLENLLHDPPPPPPPAVPEIDLTDPDILKLTLKERMEDHRNDPACYSCHAKIDPWGIAFENYDAIGAWRDKIGNTEVDASAMLFNQQELNGMDGLKHFLLENRQDQFARAMVYKLTSYALGRPLSFTDRASLEAITADVRQEGDGLKTMIARIVQSELFHSK